jgi:hypothetical protein
MSAKVDGKNLVTPAQAGAQSQAKRKALDCRLRGNDVFFGSCP